MTAPFDARERTFIEDPYPAFADLRARAPVHWHEGLGMFVAVSYAACDAVLRERALGRIWRDREPLAAFPAFNLLHQTSLLESEPPTHTRLRRLVSAAFGRGHIERMRPWVATLADRLARDLGERLRDDTSADLLETLAQPLPVEVIAELLGMPAADRTLLRPWSNAIVKMYEYDLAPVQQRAAEDAAADFTAYLRELIAGRRAHPGRNDLVSDLVAAADGDERLSEDEVVGTCVLLLMAGHEATVNVIGNGMLAMLRHPDQWRRLLDDPTLVDSAVEEMIRYDGALQLFERTATRDAEICGTRVPAGAKVAALLGAANRDSQVFADPDALDVGRFDARSGSTRAHLGFGAGIHFCLGAPLARVEVQSVLAALLRQLPALVLAEEPQRRPEFVIRGLRALQVRLATG